MKLRERTPELAKVKERCLWVFIIPQNIEARRVLAKKKYRPPETQVLTKANGIGLLEFYSGIPLFHKVPSTAETVFQWQREKEAPIYVIIVGTRVNMSTQAVPNLQKRG